MVKSYLKIRGRQFDSASGHSMKKIIYRLKRIFVSDITHELKYLNSKINGMYDMLHFLNINNLRENHKNTFVKYGKKIFSQNDEDGLTLEILNRIKITNKTFLEIGAGDGTENNTLILLANQWKGTWVDLNEQILQYKSKSLLVSNLKINKSNILGFCKEQLNELGAESYSLISLDIDGIDYYVAEKMLKNKISPEIFIVEYNPKFPPPLKFCVEYDENFQWDYTDYFGASLATYNELFEKYSYKLLCCNVSSGTNAFFIKDKYTNLFPEILDNISDIYVQEGVRFKSVGGETSINTVKNIT